MDVELYCCYSLPLRNFLYENGLRYKLAALNPNSQKLFWVYVKDEKLNNFRKEIEFIAKPISGLRKSLLPNPSTSFNR